MHHLSRGPAGGAGGTSAPSGTKPVGIGQGKPPPKRHFELRAEAAESDMGESGWSPGRGATRKRGNPRRRARRSRKL
jgi:hypothetical protein